MFSIKPNFSSELTALITDFSGKRAALSSDHSLNCLTISGKSILSFCWIMNNAVPAPSTASVVSNWFVKAVACFMNGI